MAERIEPAAEAASLLAFYDGDRARCLEALVGQFNVLQARSQLLLTLATITLTITGFSGPQIAASGAVARVALIVGLVLVLTSVALILLGNRVRWVTQLLDGAPEAALTTIIEQRNRKTAIYGLQLLALIIGLVAYVTGVIAYLGIVN